MRDSFGISFSGDSISPRCAASARTAAAIGISSSGKNGMAKALSNPAVSGDGEDGLLTQEEILGLKLSADWVVLSACNTAAAADPAGEAVSGLGRAFFYAGAKSLLVTNWAVETESAKMLTTDTFRRQAAQAGMTRAQALRQASLALLGRPAGAGPSYAHPMYWAPFSLIGDGS